MSDPRVRIAAVILDAGITCEYHEPDPECSECRRMAANLADDIAAALNAAQQPGRWVPWCVTHGKRGIASSWCTSDVLDCRWHPQGAFIPDTEKGDTT